MELNNFFSFFDWKYLQLEAPTDIYIKKMSEIKEHFLDQKTVSFILKQNKDPILYKVEKFEPEKKPGDLVFSMTTIFPGTIGKEFYFTQGHYHQNNYAEYYICIKGEGLLLLKDNEKEEIYNFYAGSIVHIKPNFAHRVVNIKNETLKFLSVYPIDAGFNYQKVLQEGGFSTKVLKKDNSDKYELIGGSINVSNYL
ncbi:glucose-6-phosphate isomerase family protein [Petrotoga sp. 9PWA.NaAc.5.4]|uniref:glucose-6-phosphate isomerase family protein n=1 Tax=Petrotoga sp. 9PWA.NaAc.5.4 TaxID=1434328 RepID=UPI000EFC3F3F|nr:glucose-6-phosphate isomerase family protein [Petrotoga sp. 9PWA.NaAc.5.4]